MNGPATRYYWWRRCSTSSGLNTINRTLLGAVPVPVPPGHEQEAIVGRAGAIRTRIDAETDTHNKLRTLKQGLMDDLLSGRVRVTSPEETSE